jgi:hypothetical protein
LGTPTSSPAEDSHPIVTTRLDGQAHLRAGIADRTGHVSAERVIGPNWTRGYPAALKALEPQDWTEIASTLTSHEDPLFSEAAEETFDAVRARILQLEQEAEAERH